MRRTGWQRFFLFTLVAALAAVFGAALQAGQDHGGTTDYSRADNWLAVTDAPTLPVDVFYLYPTAWRGSDQPGVVACRVDDPGMRQGARRCLESQASAFATVGNLYAPFYRQTDAAYVLTLSTMAERLDLLLSIPGADAVAAFDYYLRHFNQGRPFILAGHSQGAEVLIHAVLYGYFKGRPKIREKMVAAYVIGSSATAADLAANPHVIFAEGPDDVGVVVSYNTEAPGYRGNNPVVLPGAIAINPVNWSRGTDRAFAWQSRGGRRDGVDYPCLADARLDTERGVVRCSTVDPLAFGEPVSVFEVGTFHGGDFEFYYYDLRHNAANRAARFLAARR